TLAYCRFVGDCLLGRAREVGCQRPGSKVPKVLPGGPQAPVGVSAASGTLCLYPRRPGPWLAPTRAFQRVRTQAEPVREDLSGATGASLFLVSLPLPVSFLSGFSGGPGGGFCRCFLAHFLTTNRNPPTCHCFQAHL